MNSLNGKTAIVTGASKGIGAAIAQGLASAGARVAINFASDEEGAHRTANAIWNAGGKAIVVRGNVTNAADVERLFAETAEAFGAPSILVNNAGLFKFDSLADITEAEFHREFNTNVLSIFLTAQQALKHFPQSGGSIINISSIASTSAAPNSSLYSATKAAVDQVTRSLGRELGPRGIRVNTVAPGHTDTEGVRGTGFEGSELEKMLVAGTPLGRVGKPADIVPSVIFLASDEAAWVTGERIAASGGLRM
jgi:3-oxoacyl-[acyl-carrier protein] reductase